MKNQKEEERGEIEDVCTQIVPEYTHTYVHKRRHTDGTLQKEKK